MTRATFHIRLAETIRRFRDDERGVTLVELAILLPVFLLLFLGLIDFGRMSAEYVMADKAMQRAVRIAAVRPPACPGVPQTHTRGAVAPGTIPPRFGTSCSAGATVCANPGPAICTGNIADPTVNEIWSSIAPMLPVGSTPANLRFRYEFDSNLGFLGGPYVPIVTVELVNLNFQFATPLGGLATLAGANGSLLPGTLPFPSMSTSLPAEDLALGTSG